MDLPPADPCPADKRGRHHANIVIPEDDNGDLTIVCDSCFMVRRVPVTGALLGERLDDLSERDIARLFGGEG